MPYLGVLRVDTITRTVFLMSFTDQRGASIDMDVARDALLPAEKIYAGSRKGRRKHLAIYRLRIGYDWPYSEIAEAMGVSRGHACRITQQVLDAIEKISREINSSVALSGGRMP